MGKEMEKEKEKNIILMVNYYLKVNMLMDIYYLEMNMMRMVI